MGVYTLSNGLLSISINSFGAELCSVKSNDIEYIWQADPEIWARHAPNLFPIVGKLNSGIYNYQTSVYELPQHGFARDHDFICIEESEDTLIFEFTATDQTLINFPFHFSLQVSYALKNNKLITGYSVFNPDNADLYFSLGAHPAFNCPLQLNESFTDYELQFNTRQSLTIHKLKEGLILEETESVELTDHKLTLTTALFEKDALVLKSNQIEGVKLVSKKTGHGVELICKNWPYFGIWTKPGTSTFLCLEPWYGIADTVNSSGRLEDKEGIIRLKSESRFDASFTLDFF